MPREARPAPHAPPSPPPLLPPARPALACTLAPPLSAPSPQRPLLYGLWGDRTPPKARKPTPYDPKAEDETFAEAAGAELAASLREMDAARRPRPISARARLISPELASSRLSSPNRA